MTSRQALIAGVGVAFWSLGALAEGSMREEIERLRADLPSGATLEFGHVEGSPFGGVGRVEDVVITGFLPDVAELRFGELVMENAVELPDGSAESIGRIRLADVAVELADGAAFEAATMEFSELTDMAAFMRSGGEDIGALRMGSVEFGQLRFRGVDPANEVEIDASIERVGFAGIEDAVMRGLALENFGGRGHFVGDDEEFVFGIGNVSYDWLRLDSRYFEDISQPVEELAPLAEIVEALELLEAYQGDFGPFAAGPMWFGVDDTVFGVERMTGGEIDVGRTGLGMTLSIEGMGVLGPTDRDLKDTLRQEYGTDKLLFDTDLIVSHDEAGGRLALDELRIDWRDVVEGRLDFTLTGERPLDQLRRLRDSEVVNFETFGLGLASAGLTLVPGADFQAVLQQLAASMGMELDEAVAIALAALQDLSAGRPDARMDESLAALQSFFADPGRLRITVDPATPLGVHEVMTQAIMAPQQLLERANLTVASRGRQK